MKTVGQLLEGRTRALATIAPTDSVLAAVKLMAEQNIGALLVVENGKLAGIVSERDYARKVILHGKTADETPVRDIMSARVTCVQPENTVEECMALMTEKRIRHLPVIEKDKLLGMLSIGDLVKEVISEQQFMIQQLESYIHS